MRVENYKHSRKYNVEEKFLLTINHKKKILLNIKNMISQLKLVTIQSWIIVPVIFSA